MTDPSASKPKRGNAGPVPKTRADDRRGAPKGQGVIVPIHGGRIGNPPHVITDEMKIQVATLAKLTSRELAADQLGISKSTLDRHYDDIWKKNKAQAVAKVGGLLLERALKGNLTAQIFYLRTQGKWNVRLEHSGPGGGPIPVADLSRFTDAQLEEYEKFCIASMGDGEIYEPD